MVNPNKDKSRFYTISPIGIANNPGGVIALNNGADFGPDTPYHGTGPGLTRTGGLQEALNAIPLGGVLIDQGGGSFMLSESVYAAGPNQMVIFNPNSVLNLANPGSFDPQGVLFPFSNGSIPSATNFANIRWLGNGITIETNGLTSAGTILNCVNSSSGSPSTNCEISGFVLTDVLVGGLSVGVLNTTSSTPIPTASCLRFVRFAGISVVYKIDSSNTGTPEGISVVGSARYIEFRHCVVDQSKAEKLFHASCLQVSSETGGSSHISVDQCSFKASPGPACNAAYVNGAFTNSFQVTEYIVFRDCEFTDGIVNVNDAATNPGVYSYANNVEFLRCRFNSITLLFQNADENDTLFPPLAPGGPNMGWPLGYARFLDCDLGTATWATFQVGLGLQNRSPPPWPGNSSGKNINGVDVSAVITVNPLYINGQLNAGYASEVEPFDQLIVVSGGTVTQVLVDQNSTGLTQGSFLIRAGHSITVVGSGAAVTLIPL